MASCHERWYGGRGAAGTGISSAITRGLRLLAAGAAAVVLTGCAFNPNYSSLETFVDNEETRSGIGFTTDVEIKTLTQLNYVLAFNLTDLSSLKDFKVEKILKKNKPYISKALLALAPGRYQLNSIALEVQAEKNMLEELIGTEPIRSYTVPYLKKYATDKAPIMQVKTNELINAGLVKIRENGPRAASNVAYYNPLYPAVENVWGKKRYPWLKVSSLTMDDKRFAKQSTDNDASVQYVYYNDAAQLRQMVKDSASAVVFLKVPQPKPAFFKDLTNNTVYRVQPVKLGKNGYFAAFKPKPDSKVQLLGICDQTKECSWPDKLWTDTRANLVPFSNKSLRVYGKVGVDETNEMSLDYFLGRSDLLALEAQFPEPSIRGFVLDSAASSNNKWEYYLDARQEAPADAKSRLLEDLTKCYNERIRAVDTHFPTDFSVAIAASPSSLKLMENTNNKLSPYALKSLSECLNTTTLSAKEFRKQFRAGAVFSSKSDPFYN